MIRAPWLGPTGCRDHRLPKTLVIGAGIVLMLVLMAGPDRWLSLALRSADGGVVDIFRLITLAGESQGYLIATACLVPFFFAARFGLGFGCRAELFGWAAWALVFLFVAVAFGGITVNVIKVIVGRARPKLLQQDDVYGFDPFTLDADFHSFPSGHTNTLIALAMSLSFFLPRWRAALLLLGGFLTASRVVVNAHYLSDVLGSALLTVAITYWLRDRFASWGLVFTATRHGIVLQPAGRLLLRQLAPRVLQPRDGTLGVEPLAALVDKHRDFP